jgi:hypothetical protein
VPSIKRANACEHMHLTPVIKRRFGLFKRHVQVTAFCVKSGSSVAVPHLGCGICHPFEAGLE